MKRRVRQDDAGWHRVAFICQPENRAGREVATGTGATQNDACGVDTEFVTVGDRPPVRGDHVVERHGIVDTGACQPVVDGDDDRIRSCSYFAGGRVTFPSLEVAESPSSPVHPYE